MEIIIYFAQNCFSLWEWKHFAQKKTTILRRRVQIETIFKTQRRSLKRSVRKLFLQKPMNSI